MRVLKKKTSRSGGTRRSSGICARRNGPSKGRGCSFTIGDARPYLFGGLTPNKPSEFAVRVTSMRGSAGRVSVITGIPRSWVPEAANGSTQARRDSDPSTHFGREEEESSPGGFAPVGVDFRWGVAQGLIAKRFPGSSRVRDLDH